MQGRLTVLILRSPGKPLRALEAGLVAAGFDLLVRADLDHVETALQELPSPDVLMIANDSPSGTWREVVRTVERLAPHMPVIVCSPSRSQTLRDQVRESGAFYVEIEPYYPIAVQLLILAAVARKDHRRHRHQPAFEVVPAGDRAA